MPGFVVGMPGRGVPGMPPGIVVPGRVAPGPPGAPGLGAAPTARLPNTTSGVNAHSLYFVRPLKTRRLGSLLLLTTPTMPPAPAAPRFRWSN